MNNKQAAFLNTSLKGGGYLNNVCASPLSLICMSTLTTKRRAGEWDDEDREMKRGGEHSGGQGRKREGKKIRSLALRRGRGGRVVWTMTSLLQWVPIITNSVSVPEYTTTHLMLRLKSSASSPQKSSNLKRFPPAVLLHNRSLFS